MCSKGLETKCVCIGRAHLCLASISHANVIYPRALKWLSESTKNVILTSVG